MQMHIRIFFRRAAIILILLLALFSVKINAQEVVKVAYPMQEGFTQISENGEYSGYTYEYLMEIAQYTDWEYDFVQVDGDINNQLVTLMDMLKNGEIDIMGGMNYISQLADVYDYSASGYGTSYMELMALESNPNIDHSKKGLKIGVCSLSGENNEYLDKYSEVNALAYKQVLYDNSIEQVQALFDGKVDMILIKDVSERLEGTKVVANFNPTPFYFTCTKGNSDLLNKLNDAMMQIRISNPYFETDLYEKYFSKRSDKMYLSDDEKNYIENSPAIRVAIMDGNAPIQYVDKRTHEAEGITVSIMDYISDVTGLSFDIQTVASYKEMEEVCKSGSVDIIAGVNTNSDLIKNYSYKQSVPYLNIPLVMVIRRDKDTPEMRGKKLAMSQGFNFNVEYVGDVVRFENTEACLDAVRTGKADYTYTNSYSYQYYVQKEQEAKFVVYPSSDAWSQSICFAVSGVADKKLRNIINKAITSISDDDFRATFLYSKAYPARETTMTEFLWNNKWQVLTVFIILILLILLYKFYIDLRSNKRYEEISELSDEYIYEYDIKKDKLKLPKKSAAFLGIRKTVDKFSVQFSPKAHLENDTNQALFNSIMYSKDGRVDIVNRMRDGSQKWLRVVSKVEQNRHGKIVRAIGRISDVDEEMKIQADLEYRAQRDSRTGLYNVASSGIMIMEYLKNLNDDTGSFIIIDIDFFKNVNDEYGHLMGDRVLEALAKMLREEFSEKDILGRIGGDEFIVLYKEAKDIKDVEEKCKNIKHRANNMSFDNGPDKLTLSIGAVKDIRGKDWNTVYNQADVALYDVKRSGRNNYKIV